MHPSWRTPTFVLTVILVAVLVAGTIGGALLWTDDRNAHQSATQAQMQVRVEGRQISALQAQVRSLQAQNRHPTVAIWNTCGGPCRIDPTSVLVGGVPDTFVLHFAYTATVPVTLSFLGYHQWTQYDQCGFQLRCISGTYRTYPGVTRQNVDFGEGAGCAGYLYVLSSTQSGTLRPNVRATYQPASQPTGACAPQSS